MTIGTQLLVIDAFDVVGHPITVRVSIAGRVVGIGAVQQLLIVGHAVAVGVLVFVGRVAGIGGHQWRR